MVAGPRVGEEALRVEGTASAKAERWDIQLILARSLCRETRALGHVGMLARLAGRLMRGPVFQAKGSAFLRRMMGGEAKFLS